MTARSHQRSAAFSHVQWESVSSGMSFSFDKALHPIVKERMGAGRLPSTWRSDTASVKGRCETAATVQQRLFATPVISDDANTSQRAQ